LYSVISIYTISNFFRVFKQLDHDETQNESTRHQNQIDSIKRTGDARIYGLCGCKKSLALVPGKSSHESPNKAFWTQKNKVGILSSRDLGA